ncbi:MAG: hypothetical protein LAT51_06685 [Flavobacteriaceae bacterium]|nr:hypothetical protein [Flavobacteriaceae bacterium]
MKLSAMFLVVFTTLVLVAVTIMAAMNLPFNWVFYLTVFGQALVLLMVYKVLTDDYQTNRTFDDWYEDMPIKQEQQN